MTDAATPARESGSAPAGEARARRDAFVTLDRGTATCAATVVGRVDGRWRLLAATAVPTPAVPVPDALVELLLDRIRAADQPLAADLGLARPGTIPPVIEAVGGAIAHAVVLAATEASRRRLEVDATAAGWRTTGASAELLDPLETTRLATRPDVAALIVGTGDPPAADERDLVGELVALAAGVAERRPGLPVILVGAAAARAADFPLGTEVVAVPRPHGEAVVDLRAILAARRAGPADARQALVAATATLAEVLDLRIELLEVGMSGALRARAEPGNEPGAPARIAAVEAPSAVLGLVDDDAALDRVEAWATIGLDRARLRDRLAELRLAPWADLGGDGALLRAAALRAALGRLFESTAELEGPPPDLVVLAGGAWSSIPAPAALLVLADAIRRPGVVQVALDSARLLAPLGTIEDGAERARVVGELIADALVPLGTLAIARGVRGGRQAGQLRLTVGDAPVDLQLAGGRLALMDLPPGQAGAVELGFRTPVDLGVRGKRFAVRATGGLAGLVVDLRDVPLRLPERADERRDVLGSWEAALWPERDR
ncbi:MAG TPA: hypothetical protein VER83_06330 [Candidatus Nanopelagicales bacterium]|nr:hypothetical protein [Candidatus Nanopelagicales bacterium]